MLYKLTCKHSNIDITKTHFLSWTGWDIHTCNLSTWMEAGDPLSNKNQNTKNNFNHTMYLGCFFFVVVVFFIQRCQDTSQRGPQFKSLWNTWVICEFTKFCLVVLFYLRQIFTLSPSWPGIHYTRFSQNPELLLYVAKDLELKRSPCHLWSQNTISLSSRSSWNGDKRPEEARRRWLSQPFSKTEEGSPRTADSLEKPKRREQELPSGTPGTLTFASKVVSASEL